MRKMAALFFIVFLLQGGFCWGQDEPDGSPLPNPTVPPAQVTPSPPSEFEKTWIPFLGRSVAHIYFKGDLKTEDIVMRREIPLKEGDVLETRLLEDSIQALKNLQIFRSIEVRPSETESGELSIEFLLEEKLTLLVAPIAGTGGGTSYFTLFFIDRNFLGKYYELLFQYDWRLGNNSFIAYVRNPRLFGVKQNFRVMAEYRILSRSLYDKGTIYDAWSFQKTSLFAVWYRSLGWNGVSVGGQASWNRESERAEFLRGEMKTAYESRNAERHWGQYATAGTLLRWGGFDFEGPYEKGQELQWQTDKSFPVSDPSGDEWFQNRFELKFFRLIAPLDQVFAFRAVVNSNTAQENHHLPAIGGLNEIRGLRDGELTGQALWHTNSEFRVGGFLVYPGIRLQNVVFFDAGNASKHWDDAFDTPWATAGTGVRFVFYGVPLLAPRIDMGWMLNHRDGRGAGTYGVSFGLTQLFFAN